MEKITSKNNEKIKAAAKLASSPDERRRQGLFIIEGARLCEDAFLSGLSIERVFVTSKALEKYADELSFLEGLDAEIFEISQELASKISDAATAQGVFCVLKTLDKNTNIDRMKHSECAGEVKYIALDNIQDPSNLGAICRTAEALGIDGVIVCGGCDIYNPKALRASMGAFFRLSLFVVDNLMDFLGLCKERGIASYATLPHAEAALLSQVDFSKSSVCVIGNEAVGISPEVIAACSNKVTIPMAGGAESLNAAAAAAIIIWEMVR